MTVPRTTHLTPTVARAVEMAAALAGQSVSAFCVSALERHVYGSEQKATKVHEPDRSGFTYLIRCGHFFKIGRARDVEKRLRGMQLPEYELIGSARDAALERVLHRRFRHCRSRGEWFALTDLMVDEIKKLFEQS